MFYLAPEKVSNVEVTGDLLTWDPITEFGDNPVTYVLNLGNGTEIETKKTYFPLPRVQEDQEVVFTVKYSIFLLIYHNSI